MEAGAVSLIFLLGRSRCRLLPVLLGVGLTGSCTGIQLCEWGPDVDGVTRLDEDP